jgi:hypothetical protein
MLNRLCLHLHWLLPLHLDLSCGRIHEIRSLLRLLDHYRAERPGSEKVVRYLLWS